MQFRIKVLILIAILFSGFCPDKILANEQFICGKDRDGDGALNTSEVRTCSVSGKESLCPIDAVDCRVSYSPVVCPNGTAWNGHTKQCGATPASNGTEWMAVKTGSRGPEKNDCSFGDSVLPAGTTIVSNLPSGAVLLGERYVLTRCKKRDGTDKSWFDVYNYYSFTKITCPSGTSMNGDRSLCIGSPSCPSGTYDSASGQCSSGMQCPLNTENAQFACVNTGRQYQCSPNPCEDISRSPEAAADLTAFHDDGRIDSTSGTCSGEMMVFNGKPTECRTEGYQTGYFNCCSLDSSSILAFMKSCKEEEKMLITNRDGGACHRVGQYCKKNSRFGCLQKAETYCCFGSKLARLVHEQGRNQLKEYSANNLWGSPAQPFCNGMSSEQLSLLDFNQMDLSEYVGSLVTDKDLFSSVEKEINAFYSNISP